MEGKCWFCKHFYEKCDNCINKIKWELWEGNESNNLKDGDKNGKRK